MVAVIEDKGGRVLISRRPPGVHQGGLWEFPGGKLEPGEAPAEALHREIMEELGVRVISHRPLIKVIHRYSDREVLLDVYRVTDSTGQPRGREGQPLSWCAPLDLNNYPMPAADRPIISALRLPPAYVITDQGAPDTSVFLQRAEAVLGKGLRLIQFRAPEMAPAAYRSLAIQLVERCQRYEASLLLNASVDTVLSTGAQGIHLNSRQLRSIQSRPLSEDYWVAASCHSAAELEKARQIGVDFAVLSPVLPTASHPGATTLGWQGFRRLVEEAPFPVFALGGMTLGDTARSQEMGGQGVAAIRGLWNE